MKKLLFLFIAVSLLFSSWVAFKTLNRMDVLSDAAVEALAEGENDVYYQTMGYCGSVLTYKCTLYVTSERCRIYVCREPE